MVTAAALFAAICAGPVGGCSSPGHPSGPARATPSAAADGGYNTAAGGPTATPPTSIAPFRTNGGIEPLDGLATAQKWANDVAAGRMDTLVAKCWTFAPERVRAMYGDPGWLANILATPGEPAQIGMVWSVPPGSVSTTWEELRSDYPCPVVEIPGVIDNTLHDFDARHLVLRALSRQTGHPIAPSDTQANYPLGCEVGLSTVPDLTAGLGPMRSFDPTSIRVTMSGSGDDSVARVTATVDGRTVTFGATTILTHPCISSIS